MLLPIHIYFLSLSGLTHNLTTKKALEAQSQIREELILHSDQGSQYWSYTIKADTDIKHMLS